MPSSERLILLACQIAIPPMTTPEARDAHLETSVAKVAARLDVEGGAVDLVVLPELSSIDYSRVTFAELARLGEALDGPSFRAWSEVARRHRVHVVYGFARSGASGFHICQAVVGPDGTLIGHYDKIHLAQYGASMEKEYFERGDHLFLFEVNGFRIAPIICYDIRIPELARTLAVDRGAEVILHCGAYFRDESFHTWHPFVITRALENQVFLLSVNRAGADYGSSLFCLPWLDQDTPPIAFSDTGEDFRVLTLERETLCSARRTYSFLKDRLSDYRALASEG